MVCHNGKLTRPVTVAGLGGHESRFAMRHESEANLLGVRVHARRGDDRGPVPRASTPAHWVFAGTGLKAGDLFGEKCLHRRCPGGASGHETDKVSPSSPANVQRAGEGPEPRRRRGGHGDLRHAVAAGRCSRSGRSTTSRRCRWTSTCRRITANVLRRFLEVTSPDARHEPTMKITRIEPIPVCVPLKKGMTAKTAHGEHVTSPYVHREGPHRRRARRPGRGDHLRRCGPARRRPGTVAAIRDYIAPPLVGKDPRDITAARRAMDFIIKLNPFTKAAVEMALWDIAGKAAGRAGVPAARRQGPRPGPHQARRLGPRRARLADDGRGAPQARRDVREGEGRPRPGDGHRPGAGGPRGRRAGHPGDHRRQLRVDDPAGEALPAAAGRREPAARRAADPGRRPGGAGRAAPRHPDARSWPTRACSRCRTPGC